MHPKIPIRLLAVATFIASWLLLLGSSMPAHAAGTCQGRAATIEGSGDLTGTSGDDVILAIGAATVRGNGGTDLVCHTGSQVFVFGERISVLSQAPAGTGGTVYLSATSYASYVGTPATETVYIWRSSPTAFDVDLTSGGNDTAVVVADVNPTAVSTGSVRFGPGATELIAVGFENTDVDLANGTLSIDGAVTATVSGTSNVYALGKRVSLRGDSGANRLRVRGCDAVVKGGKGPDVLAKGPYDDGLDPGTRCAGEGGGYTLKGGDGNDTLSGTVGNDRLLGGPGRDTANGRGGHDRCRTEVVRHCGR